MKMMVTGIEIQEGIGKTSKRAYSIGSLHTSTQLAPPMGEGNVAKGHAGDKFECPVELLRKVEHLAYPCMMEVEVVSQIRFGERQQVVVDLKPIAVLSSKAAA